MTVLIDDPIDVLKLSCRAYNVLYHNNIQTIGRLTRLSRRDIRRLHNAGTKTADEIASKLEQHGLHLDTPSEEEQAKRRIQLQAEDMLTVLERIKQLAAMSADSPIFELATEAVNKARGWT